MKLASPIFNDQQKRRAIIWLSFFHIFIIAASNYFVQIPFEITLKLTALGAANDSKPWNLLSENKTDMTFLSTALGERSHSHLSFWLLI
mgnify:CR=1 FL=1